MFLQIKVLNQKYESTGKWSNIYDDHEKIKAFGGCLKWLKNLNNKRTTLVCLIGDAIEKPSENLTATNMIKYIKKEKEKLQGKNIKIHRVNNGKWVKEIYHGTKIIYETESSCFGRDIKVYVFETENEYISIAGKKGKRENYYVFLQPSIINKKTMEKEEVLRLAFNASINLKYAHERTERVLGHLFLDCPKDKATELSNILFDFILSCPPYSKLVRDAVLEIIKEYNVDKIKFLMVFL
jgi:hypothetical protein